MIDWSRAEELIKNGASDKEVAEEVGCKYYTVKKHRLDMGISHSRNLDYEIVDVLIYINSTKETRDEDVARTINCSPVTIALRRRKLGIKKRYKEYVSRRAGVAYYPDVVRCIIDDISKQYRVKGDFGEWAKTHQAEIHEWNEAHKKS